ncbi:MAG: substrate-binding domain-containing protein [Rhizobiaceae bacterium]|nr:substrate-binding domain-containing protein [Rhizobiaceae bacterium]
MTILKVRLAALASAVCLGVAALGSAYADETAPARASRSYLWHNGPVAFTDTSAFKKEGPYTIGFSNASISNIWAVGFLHALEHSAEKHKDKIKKLIITDANDNPTKQVSDIQDLIQRNVDLLIIRPSTEAVDAAVVRAIKQGIPVVLADRRTATDDYTSFVTADDWGMGRSMALWMVEKLGGKGNVVLLSGIAGASPAELRAQAAMEVFNQYPDIKVLDRQFTDWSPAKGKTVMAALIQKYGQDIDGVWSDAGLQASGAMEAYVAAGVKDGEIPPMTCQDLNSCWVNAIKHKVPMMSIDNPPAGGGVAMDVAIKVLEGLPVPHNNFIDSTITVTKGDETPSVKADIPAEDYAKMDAPGDLILSTGIPNYDPKTFTADYPR